jgi:hypothetical protein
VELRAERCPGGKIKVTARRGDELLHADLLDPASAAGRTKFVKALGAKVPALDGEVVERELLRLADDAGAGEDDQTPELDLRGIVRPELFFHPAASGISVPVVVRADGRTAGRYVTYIQWADGRRERRELADSLDLPGGGRLWFHPSPAEPPVSAVAGWSAEGRRRWLEGVPAPDPADLFRRVCERVAYFLDLPPDVAKETTATLAVWTMLTYGYPAWPAIPYLFVGGPLGSGKTRVFEILARLVFRALVTSNLTAPALFRTLHDRGGVVLFDEAERLRQSTPDQLEIRAMFLAGYKRGGTATRLEAVGDSFRPVEFQVYGPKALACVAGLPPALSSRCVRALMFRAPPDSPKPKRRIDADPEGWRRLRDDLHALAVSSGPAWADLAGRAEVCPAGLGGRDFELWQPLLAVASWVEAHGAGGLLRLLQRHALASVEAARDDQTPEADEVLLDALAESVRRGEAPTPGELLTRAKDRDPVTFAKWVPQTVSGRLEAYGVARPKKSHGVRRYRGVGLAELQRVQRHYGLDLGIPEEGHRHPIGASPPVDPLATRPASAG